MLRLSWGCVVLVACSGRNAPSSAYGGDFYVLATDPPPGAEVRLNDSIAITFTRDVDLQTADLNAVSFAVFDLNGTPLQEQARGTFATAAQDAGAGDQRVLLFQPAFPTNDDYSNGGFKPGRRYLLQLAHGDPRNGAILRDTAGKGLRDPFTLQFQTVDGTTASQLFRDQRPGGPHVVRAEVTPADSDGIVHLGRKGEPPVAVRLQFDQPLNPASTNVPYRLDPDPARIDPRRIATATKGRVYLEYDDSEYGQAAWIPALVDIESNHNGGSALRLTPTGVLPNDAQVRVIVEPALEDLAGESNASAAAHARTAFTFTTEAAREPQFDAIVEDFSSLEMVDFEAAFLEPMAEVGQGFVRAGFAFAGIETAYDYRPHAREVVLNTDFTQITPTNGPPFGVAGGVFQFRNVTIPAHVTVRGTGSKPMVWLVTGDFVVEGELTVAGGHGARVDTLNSANYPTPGGIASCGGGNGGRGSPSAFDTDNRGEHGYGAYQAPALGGRGGEHACRLGATCGRGGGGGGGSFATRGDPHYSFAWLENPPALPLVGDGKGGRMCDPARANTQAAAGPLGFLDARRDNDFWGSQVDLARQLRIHGELLATQGGAGGGGGGDTNGSTNNVPDPIRCAPNPTFLSDRKGGGGGAGGGVLIVKALGRIVVKSAGVIDASGGHGGGGEEAGSNSVAGGGGGGSGGMIVLMSASGIHLAAHGAPYADALITSNTNGAYDFAIAADGGVGLRGTNSGFPIDGKYPGKGGPTATSTWDFNPVGGFGGLGVVQLMAPPGDNRNGDDTRTRLDDNICFYPNDAALAVGLDSPNPHGPSGPALIGAQKIAMLGWRGFPDEEGNGVDDDGNPVLLARAGHGEGDIRPAPILLPAPFGAVSRLRSRWIDTGATARLADSTGTDRAPRKMVEQIDSNDPTHPFTSLRVGPTYTFSGTFHGATEPQGYVRYRQTPTSAERDVSEVLAAPAAVATLDGHAQWRGAPAYRLVLRDVPAVLARIPGRYTGYRALLRDARGSAIGSFRILGHAGSEIHLSPDAGLLPDATPASVQVVADLIGYRTSASADMGATSVERRGSTVRNVPLVNARVGFAFHVNPSEPAHPDLRLPAGENEFLYELDVARPEVMRRIRDLGKAHLGTRGATAVQYDIWFNMAFSEFDDTHVDRQRTLSPLTPRPELRYLVLPFQF